MRKVLLTLTMLLLTLLVIIYCANNDQKDQQVTPNSPIPENNPIKPDVAFQVSGYITDIYSNPLSGVKVKCGNAELMTDGKGRFTYKPENNIDNKLLFVASLDGYAPQFESLYTDGKNSVSIDINLKKWDTVSSIQTGKQTTITSKNIYIEFPKDTVFVDTKGSQIRGEIEAYVSIINPEDRNQIKAFQGNFSGIRNDSTVTPVETLGLFTLNMNKNGEKINILPSTPVKVTYKVPNLSKVVVGDIIPLWYFDETVGEWIEDGSATVQRDANNELVGVGTVSHFTTWNWDVPSQTTCLKGKLSIDSSNIPNFSYTMFLVEAIGVDYLGGAYTRPTSTGDFCVGAKPNSYVFLKIHANINGNSYEIDPAYSSLVNPINTPATIMDCPPSPYSQFSLGFNENDDPNASPCFALGNIPIIEITQPPLPPPPPPPNNENCIKGTVNYPDGLPQATCQVKVLHRSGMYAAAYATIFSNGFFCVDVPHNGAYDIWVQYTINGVLYESTINPVVVVANSTPGIYSCQYNIGGCNDAGNLNFSGFTPASN